MGGTFNADGDEDGGDTRVLQNDDEGDGDESVAVLYLQLGWSK